MAVEIKIPQIGESISEAILSSWLVSDGDYVEKDQEIAEIDSDKATIMLNTEQAGEVKLLVEEGA
ncbi:MAG: biotin/lipoyl-binding protein, partial [Bacteroidetes bacterium]|nr:biotin/lipoyl-binding protein [Bacteroidota bacterium]